MKKKYHLVILLAALLSMPAGWVQAKTVTIEWTMTDTSNVQSYKLYYAYSSDMAGKMWHQECAQPLETSPGDFSMACTNVVIDQYPVYFTIAAVADGSEQESPVKEVSATLSSPKNLSVITGTENASPIAKISADTTTGAAPLTVSFDAGLSSDPDGSISHYLWNFGDGETATDVAVSHTFSGNGNYTVMLTVTDNDGATSPASTLISVGAVVSCIGGGPDTTECNPSNAPDQFLSKNTDRTNVIKWKPDRNGIAKRIKVYFGACTNGTWQDFTNVKVVLYRGRDIIATANINPVSNLWIWSDEMVAMAGQSLTFNSTDELSFGLSIDTPAVNPPSYSFGYFTNNANPSFYYKNEYLTVGESWGVYNDRKMAVILEYIPQ